MISKTKLWSIGKLSIATLLLLTTSIRMAKAADPAAAQRGVSAEPTDVSATYLPGNNNSIQISWRDNTVDETKFVVVIQQVSNGVIRRFDHAAIPGRGTRTTSNHAKLVPGFYRYRVCVVQVLGETCSPLGRSFSTPQGAYNKKPSEAFKDSK